MSAFNDAWMLVAIFDGEYVSDDIALTHICDVEGSVTPDGERPLTVLEETSLVLEICADKYRTPAKAEDAWTVLLGHVVRGIVTALAGLDVHIEHRLAHSSIVRNDMHRVDAESVTVESGEDVMAIARKVFEVGLRYGRF